MMTKARFTKEGEGFASTIQELSEETVKTELTDLVQRLTQKGVTQNEIVGALKKEFTDQKKTSLYADMKRFGLGKHGSNQSDPP